MSEGKIKDILQPQDFQYLEEKYCKDCVHNKDLTFKEQIKIYGFVRSTPMNGCPLFRFISLFSTMKKFDENGDLEQHELLFSLEKYGIITLDPISCKLKIKGAINVGN